MPQYRLNLEFYRPGEKAGWSLGLGKPDLEPALEWAQFQALRSAEVPIAGTALFRPITNNGDARMAGFRVDVPTESASFTTEFRFDYFAADADRHANALVETGKLRAGEEFHWAMSAWTSEDGDGIGGEIPISRPAAPVAPGCLNEFLSRSERVGNPNESEFKVFIPRAVLDETADLAVTASPMECGGVLLGNLRRDTDSGELFGAVTAYIPALHAVASELDLRFTPDAWNAVRAAINLRGGDETWLGWAHSHTPVSWDDKCGRCPAERQHSCPLATRLFSPQDRVLHRTVFPRSFSIGLVANVLADGVVHSCFGWREGKIEFNPFYALEER